MRWLIRAAYLGLFWGVPAFAHGGELHDDTPRWSAEPLIAVPLFLLLGLYLWGSAQLRCRGANARPDRRRKTIFFLSGWVLLAGALLSPLHEAGERSFTFHMIEHEIIMLPAALLFVLGRPGPTLLWALPREGRQFFAPIIRWRVWRVIAAPMMATALQAGALLLWHAPALFNRALVHDGWHISQHLCFLITALLFWHAMTSSVTHRGLAALCLFVTSVIGGGLGALMALAKSPWYPAYAAMPMRPFGLSAVEDQQLAGLIMWVPGGLFHLAAALLLLLALLRPQPQKFSTIV